MLDDVVQGEEVLRISLTATCRKYFEYAMEIAFCGAAGGKAKHYRIIPEKGMVLYWHEDTNTLPLPYPMDLAAAQEFVWNWLRGANCEEDEPDHDGDNDKGYCVYNEAWGHAGGSSYGFVAIQPSWIVIPK